MQNRRRFRRIDVDLDGVIRFQRASDAAGCVIRNINEECAGVMIATSDARVCAREDLNLGILIPADRSPVKCTGRIVWYSEDKESFKAGADYEAGILITDISRIDRRRLELVMARKRTPFGSTLIFSNPFSDSSRER
jgi:hypothetical protein